MCVTQKRFSLVKLPFQVIQIRIAEEQERHWNRKNKNKQKKKQRKIPFKMMSVLFCLLRVHLLLSNLNTVYHVNGYMSDD